MPTFRARELVDVSLRIAAFGLLLASLPAFAQTATTEVGVTSGADYRVDMPANWNHSLVVYYHGYALGPTHFKQADKPAIVIASCGERAIPRRLIEWLI